MSFYKDYRAKAAQSFLDEHEAKGFRFHLDHGDVAVSHIDGFRTDVNMKSFQFSLKNYREEIKEILMRRRKTDHLKLAAVNGKSV